MFGTIGHFRVKPGHEAQVRELNEAWARELRPTIPGFVVQLWGHPEGRAGELVEVVLMHDEATYRGLAARPEQDAWYRQLVAHLEGEPTWEDIAWDGVRADASADASQAVLG